MSLFLQIIGDKSNFWTNYTFDLMMACTIKAQLLNDTDISVQDGGPTSRMKKAIFIFLKKVLIL